MTTRNLRLAATRSDGLRNVLLASTSIIAAAALAVPAAAQEQPAASEDQTQTAPPEASPANQGDVVVTGYRASIEDSLRRKRAWMKAVLAAP